MEIPLILLLVVLLFKLERDPFQPTAEWLEADGLGGFASGRAPTMSRSENQPPPPSSAACDRAAATQKQP
jgi:hypothetical protein